MYTNTGYMSLQEDELLNEEIPLRVNSCGVYRLKTLPLMSTFRPTGRPDYQILYIASGKACFNLEGHSVEVAAGNMVLYLPKQAQQYAYYLIDKPEVYWVHFTGSDARKRMEEAGFDKSRILNTGISSKYQEVFSTMIQELQLPRSCSSDLASLSLLQLCFYLKRMKEEGGFQKTQSQREMEQAVRYFHENLSKEIEVENYAKKLHMSTCWFIRSFKSYTGMPPRKYLTSIRIKKAKELLESTDYSVGEIGGIVGYDNPFYFSRIFKKISGNSPAQYRKAAR